MDLLETEFGAFHDFAENVLKPINIKPKEIQPGMSFSPLEGLGNYKNGDLLSAMVNAKEAITFRRSNNNDLKSEAKRLEIQTIPNKVIKINWEFS